VTALLSSTLLAAQSDARLAALAAEGHDRAFEAIVERYRRPLGRYLRRLLSETLAEDVLQATFVRAWQAMRGGPEVRDLRPWLYRIAHNQAVNALRAAGERTLPEVEPAPGPEVAVTQRDELRRTLDDIGELPDRQRAALVAVAVADRPHSDVAAELGLSDGALRQLLLRARTALRAAATALTPTPLATWLAAGQDATAGRVAEVALGAGGVGVAVKAGAAALATSAVVVGAPVAFKDRHDAPARAKQAPAATTPASNSSAADDHDGRSGPSGRRERERGDDHDGRSGPSGRGERERGDDHGGRSGSEGNSGHGSGSSGLGSSGHRSEPSGSGSSGSGSSGHGSGSSGSGSSGHGSGSSGSGSSGSGSSGSGSSASGKAGGD
jgi:RNA polymerase sigma factor (sigma-70 family)